MGMLCKFYKRVKLASQPERFIRILNTNIDGSYNLIKGLKCIKGIGLRFSQSFCNKLNKCYYMKVGSIKEKTLSKILFILSSIHKSKIPFWLHNCRNNLKPRPLTHLCSGRLESQIKNDFEKECKLRSNRGIRYSLGLKHRGQHTKTNGRKGRTLGVIRKKKK